MAISCFEVECNWVGGIGHPLYPPEDFDVILHCPSSYCALRCPNGQKGGAQKDVWSLAGGKYILDHDPRDITPRSSKVVWEERGDT